jgi:hypothetical protein
LPIAHWAGELEWLAFPGLDTAKRIGAAARTGTAFHGLLLVEAEGLFQVPTFTAACAGYRVTHAMYLIENGFEGNREIGANLDVLSQKK